MKPLFFFFHKIIFLVILIGVHSFSVAQSSKTIKGKVVNDADASPIANCSVFIDNTSKGTTTNASGEFELANFSPGKYQIVVSSIGYETYTSLFSTSQLPLTLNIRLKQKTTGLSTVVVEPFLKDGWETWGQTFIENLIGTTEFASQCKILNKEVVRFRYSTKKELLTAVADEPIVIENKALGYIIKFKLEDFSADMDSHTSIYSGYPLFSDMPSKSFNQQLEWQKNRKDAYLGSIMHFVRCLYTGDITRGDQFNQEGFEIRKNMKVPNAEKLRVRQKYNADAQTKNDEFPEDSVRYFKKILKQPDSVGANVVLSSADLVTSNDDQGKEFFFTGKLSIIYRKRRKIDTDVQRSTIYLLTPAPVQIEENGYYNSPLEIFTMGHWARSQKL
ncbi:MAG: carboxypeptidase-like regulatory domain-containing protein, partial [Bacteroidetes bacterium]|nr:carboxypeptidase-like regulatory domain-containing protein [Bacteroidota bacterium]